MSNTKESTNWRIHHQSHFRRYESQEAALVAIESIVSNYENRIWVNAFPTFI
ncbi:MAG: hypothetical protein LH613_16440 [Chamaesiphon sp.]|nr:hypothetical protein [Chamaesiphon sp.]